MELLKGQTHKNISESEYSTHFLGGQSHTLDVPE